MISNGGFETNTDGWFGFGAVTLASTPDHARTGSRSGRVSANFYIEGAPAGVDIYLDDVEMRELP